MKDYISDRTATLSALKIGCDCGPDYKCPSIDRHGAERYYCTRPRGHGGPHVACTPTEHDVKRW